MPKRSVWEMAAIRNADPDDRVHYDEPTNVIPVISSPGAVFQSGCHLSYRMNGIGYQANGTSMHVR